MLRLLLAVLLFAAPVTAFASGGGKDEKAAAEPYVDLALMGLPIIVDGKAVNYVFVQLRLHVGPGQDAIKLRTQEPFYRDAVVRAAHRTPFVDAKDWRVVDEARVKGVALAEARRISGARGFSSGEICDPTPRRRGGLGPQA